MSRKTERTEDGYLYRRVEGRRGRTVRVIHVDTGVWGAAFSADDVPFERLERRALRRARSRLDDLDDQQKEFFR